MVDTIPVPEWHKRLQARGILATAQAAGWTADGAGWKYPLYAEDSMPNGHHRWKAFDSGAKPKYLWPDGKGDTAYYLLPGTIEAIEKASGGVIIVSGEPDVLSLKAAGAHNVLCWFGENAIPASVVDDFKRFGIHSIESYPDRDAAGETSAKELLKKLNGSGIHIKFFELPGAMGSKYDINRLWIDSNFNHDTFWDALTTAPSWPIELSLGEDLPLLNSSSAVRPAEFYRAIESALGVTEYKPNGFSKEVICPFHDDKKPSAGWHSTKHVLKCMACNAGDESYGADKVAERLGIRWQDYAPKETTPHTASKTVAAPRPAPVGAPQVLYSWEEATKSALAELLGDKVSLEALPVHWQNLRRFGGLSKLITPGKMVAVVADSGAGKTSFMETQMDAWLRLGYHGVVWSPEWSKEQLVYRAIQRAGGPSVMQIIEHNTWKSYANRGVPDDKNPGTKLTDSELKRAVDIANDLLRRPGQLHVIDRMGVDVYNLSKHITDAMDKVAVSGKRVAFAIVDYAQLVEAKGTSDNERTKESLNKLKQLTVDRQLVTLVGSQITKEAGRLVAEGGKANIHMMQGMRSDVFNLMLSIVRKFDGDGNMENNATVTVSKNSLGRNGRTMLRQDPNRLTWDDVDERLTAPSTPPASHYSEKELDYAF